MIRRQITILMLIVGVTSGTIAQSVPFYEGTIKDNKVDYSLKAFLDNNKVYQFQLLEAGKSKEEARQFQVSPYTYDNFKNALESAILGLRTKGALEVEVDDNFNNESLKLFYEIIAQKVASKTEAPPAVTIHLSRKVAGKVKKKDQLEGNPEYVVGEVQIEFKSGMIETIKVYATSSIAAGYSKQEVILRNNYPIGFSTDANFRKLEKHKLSDQINGTTYSVVLGDVLKADMSLVSNQRDHSPQDGVYTMVLNKDKDVTKKVLYKEETRNILMGTVYTDFNGLNDDNPNGLIQLEVSKRVNLYTWRRRIWFTRFNSWSTMQYLKPSLTFSKIEENNRRFDLYNSAAVDEILDEKMNSKRYITVADLVRYRNFNFDLDLNLALVDLKTSKTTFYLNTGYSFGSIAFKDSTATLTDTLITRGAGFEETEDRINQWYLKWILELRSEHRYGVDISWTSAKTFIRNKQIFFAKDYDKVVFENSSYLNSVLNTFTFNAFLNVGQDDTNFLYFRYKYHFMWKNPDVNFDQIQVGYSKSILNNK